MDRSIDIVDFESIKKLIENKIVRETIIIESVSLNENHEIPEKYSLQLNDSKQDLSPKDIFKLYFNYIQIHPNGTFTLNKSEDEKTVEFSTGENLSREYSLLQIDD